MKIEFSFLILSIDMDEVLRICIEDSTNNQQGILILFQKEYSSKNS